MIQAKGNSTFLARADHHMVHGMNAFRAIGKNDMKPFVVDLDVLNARLADASGS